MVMGKVKNGIVVLDKATSLPDGTQVRVEPVRRKPAKAKTGKRNTKVRGALLKLAGKAKGLPPDASENVDHYLYGHPKK